MLYTHLDGRVSHIPDRPLDIIQAPIPTRREVTTAWNTLMQSLEESQVQDLESALTTIRRVIGVD